MSNQLHYEELFVLLNQAGATAPVGIDGIHFPVPPDEVERQKVLEVGSTKQSGRENDNVVKMVPVIANARSVLHINYRPQSGPDQDRWYFTDGNEIVKLKPVEERLFALDKVSDRTALFSEIERSLPLIPSPEELSYYINVDQDDFQVLRDLASEWNEVPALEILEADGLDTVAARDLFDSAVEPEWRGIVECLICQGQRITDQYTIRVGQGAETSWMIRPSMDGRLIVETVGQGLFQNALAEAWNWLTEGMDRQR